MADRQRVLENIALDNVDPRTLGEVRELLPRDGTGTRQFEQRSPQIGVALQDRNEKRAGAASDIENLIVAAEVVICRQRRRARAGEGFHAGWENLLLALIEFADCGWPLPVRTASASFCHVG